MSPLRAAWKDLIEAMRAFSRPARHFLLTDLLAGIGQGAFGVLFNLYLVAGGLPESLVGRAVSLNAVGLAMMALPAGILADRWGRRRTMIVGVLVEAVGLLARSVVLDPHVVFAASFLAGAGQSMIAIPGAPFLTEHSTPRERTHLFSVLFATTLLAGVVGSAFGGWLPNVLRALAGPARLDLLHAYRVTLVLGTAVCLCAVAPLLALRGVVEARVERSRAPSRRAANRQLVPIGVNAFLLGSGAGLIIPFMNLYFATRFRCSSAQIGMFFSIAQVFTAAAALIGPAIARRYGKLKTATIAELLSLPFLVTLGVERHLEIAVAAFWFRATLMQASNPLIQAFIMEALPVELRARSTSLTNLVWNIGWASSASLAGVIIMRFGYSMPFYMTACFYSVAAVTMYLAFRRQPEVPSTAPVAEEVAGQRSEGALTE